MHWRYRVLALVTGLLSIAGGAAGQGFDHTHAVWSRLLAQHVTIDGGTGTVDYRGILDDRVSLDRYLDGLSAVPAVEFSTWSTSRRLAFLINAYNAFTVGLVVDHYPMDSIRDLGGWFSSPWKRRFFRLLGEDRHLDDIEHGMIRKDFDEPRIHFALNCAARGCPPLQAEAYVADRLDRQLEDASRRFLRDRRRNRFSAAQARLELSSVMDWYRDDFEREGGSLHDFVAPRISDDPAVVATIRARQPRVRFLDYDWALNDR